MACAVLIPASSYQPIEKLLPQANGSYLKSSDKDLADFVVTGFFSEILKTRCTITFISIDLGSASNVAAAKRVAYAANQFRKRAGQRANSPQNYQYISCTSRPILTCWVKYFGIPNPANPFPAIDIILDGNSPLKKWETKRYQQELKAKTQNNGYRLRTLSWRLRNEDPLLLVPDLLAGIYRYSAISNRWPMARSLLNRAIEIKRVNVIDSYTVGE